jgi:hypothetical protein
MSKLNKDVILLILEELQDDSNSLYSCLLVNRTWCEMTVPILWKNPSKQCRLTKNACEILYNVILLHLSEELKHNLRSQKIKLSMTKPLFNYISFWRYLDLYFLEYIMNINFKISHKSNIGNEILKLFVNSDMKFTSLSISNLTISPLYYISGAEHCFSTLECFYCDYNINSDILEKVAIINTSIKKLSFNMTNKAKNIYNTGIERLFGIERLIKSQKNLKEVNFILNNFFYMEYKSYHKTLEESLIKCADTVQYLRIDWRPISKFLSYLVNLVSLEINVSGVVNWSLFEKVSLPLLKFLRTRYVPSKVLASLIENTKGYLIEINILYHYIVDYGRLIQAIYQYCPNLSYLRLSLFNADILEFENLLINCEFLNKLEVISTYNGSIKWDKLFEILTESSPISLFKFSFTFCDSSWESNLKSLKLFLDNWKDRHPMLLHLFLKDYYFRRSQQEKLELENLIQEYEVKSIIKKCFTETCKFPIV